MAVDFKLNNPNCKINFEKIKHKANPPSLEEALNSIEPFYLSEDVLSGKTKIIVTIPENWRELKENHV